MADKILMVDQPSVTDLRRASRDPMENPVMVLVSVLKSSTSKFRNSEASRPTHLQKVS
jgi:hypothetical protein